jgi:hypothetical protein
VKGFFGNAALATDSELTEYQNECDVPITTTARAEYRQAGDSFFAISSLRHLGLMGELGISPLHQYRWAQSFSPEGLDECQNRGRFSGVSVHASSSVTMPFGRTFVLAPTLSGSMGSLFSERSTYGCESNDAVPVVRFSTPDSSVDFGLFLSIGGDFYFGGG